MCSAYQSVSCTVNVANIHKWPPLLMQESVCTLVMLLYIIPPKRWERVLKSRRDTGRPPLLDATNLGEHMLMFAQIEASPETLPADPH